MADFDTEDQTSYSGIHPMLLAADTANMQAGSNESLIDSTSNFLSAAVRSGFASIYNTGANLIGAEQFDVAKWMEENDQHMGAYYAKNKQLVDVAGFAVTSLVPGGLALKGVQLAKTGTMLGPFGRALGYASSRQSIYLEQGLKELAVEGGSVFRLINGNKLASMAWGTADQIINVAAFETMVALTMKQSPLLEKDEWTDVAKHIGITSLAFGVFGGGIEAIAINSIFKQGSRTIDAAMREFDVVKRVQGDISFGDQAHGIAASILNLPHVGRDIEFTYKFGGKDTKLQLPTKEALERASTSATRRGWDDFKETLNKMAGGDTALGNEFGDYLYRMVQTEQAAGRTNAEIVERLGDHLYNVKTIRRVGTDAPKGSDNIFYLPKELTPEAAARITNFDSFLTEVVSRSPQGKETLKHPYQLVGNINEIKLGLVGLRQEAPTADAAYARFGTIDDAFQAGQDAVVLANGTIKINPKSKMFKTIEDPATAPRSFFNTRTGSFSDVAFPTVADIASTTKPLAMTGVDSLVSGGHRPWIFTPTSEFALKNLDTLDASARYVYASELKVVPGKVWDTDIPMLERIFQDGSQRWKDIVLKSADGMERKVSEIADFGDWLKSQKLTILQSYLEKTTKGEDLLSLSTKMNVDARWVQDAIASSFLPTERLATGFSVPLKDSLKPQNLEVIWDFERAKELAGTQYTLGGKTLTVPKNKAMIQVLPDGAGNTIYGELDWAYRVKVGNDARNTAFASVMEADAAKFMEINADTVINMANQGGAGAGLVKSANADYGDTLGLWAQYTGTLVNQLGRKASNATLTEMQPLMLKIKDSKEAAAELGVLVTALRRNTDKYMIHPEDPLKLVNREAVSFNKELGKFVIDDAKLLEIAKGGRKAEYVMQSQDVADFISQSTIANARRIEKNKVLMASRGWNYNYDPLNVYIPPVDTSRYPYFAFVRQQPGTLGGSSEVSMITARTEQELQKLVTKVPNNYEVVFKENAERYHKIKGDYDYALSIKEPSIDSTLQKRGVLGDFFPETRAENVLDDFINWHQRQEVSLVRRAVETKYAQTFEELRGIGRQFTELGTSKTSAALKKFKSQIENPFEDYIKTALDISKRSEYTLLHEANEFAESLGKTAYRVFGANREKALQGLIPWQEANRLSEKYGLKGPYTDDIGYFTANLPEEKNIVKEFVAKANMTLVNLNLRLDWANSLVNIISTPILLGTEMASIRTLVANDSALAGKLNELRSITLPGTEARIPSTTGLIAKSFGNFFGAEKEALLSRYKEIGSVKDMLSQYHEMLEHFSYKPYKKVGELVDKGNKGIELGAKMTGNGFAEEFTRFVSADVMRQLTDPIVAAGRLSLAEQNAYIVTFVNRVQGNYLASQRPIAFQGVLGSAVSLFQTYQFNLLQQLFRHVENRDTKTLAIMAGLQGGLYGLNGIPFFEAMNTHLIGHSNLNPGHRDVYSTAPQILGKQFGDWMMYGAASAFPFWSSSSPALYTRGDINPRHISILPISPLDVPAVDGSIRFVSNLLNVGSKAVKGADLSSTLLEGLEHNSLSRPLAGIAQVAQGYATTSKGSLISASNDFFSIVTFSRVIGAKPMDESLALNSKFRLQSYQAADAQRIQDLGEVVKTKLRAGKTPTLEELHDFQLQYAKAGGRIENYAKTLQRWSRDANVSVINQMAQQHRTSYSQRLQEIMGGTTLQDFKTRPSLGAVVPPNDEQINAAAESVSAPLE